MFYQDDGGFRATDCNNRPLTELYYLGIIDILTPYNMVKRVENAWKGLTYDRVCGVLWMHAFILHRMMLISTIHSLRTEIDLSGKPLALRYTLP